jgi:hypothetical protein
MSLSVAFAAMNAHFDFHGSKCISA